MVACRTAWDPLGLQTCRWTERRSIVRSDSDDRGVSLSPSRFPSATIELVRLTTATNWVSKMASLPIVNRVLSRSNNKSE